MPLNKINNKSIKTFLEKYTGRRVPDRTTIARNHVETIYLETVEKIRENIAEKSIWVSIDETTDSMGR